ncbi:hypothetical protein A8L44_06170 [Bacillus sp. FJAT-27986]|nr:hypothetical protein A8L44_06170 [Bacillus sp. FJAT-27986]
MGVFGGSRQMGRRKRGYFNIIFLLERLGLWNRGDGGRTEYAFEADSANGKRDCRIPGRMLCFRKIMTSREASAPG